MQLCGEFNNAHLDTSIASIDPKYWNYAWLKGLTPKSENCTKSYWSETFNHGAVYIPLAIS